MNIFDTVFIAPNFLTLNYQYGIGRLEILNRNFFHPLERGDLRPYFLVRIKMVQLLLTSQFCILNSQF